MTDSTAHMVELVKLARQQLGVPSPSPSTKLTKHHFQGEFDTPLPGDATLNEYVYHVPSLVVFREARVHNGGRAEVTITAHDLYLDGKFGSLDKGGPIVTGARLTGLSVNGKEVDVDGPCASVEYSLDQPVEPEEYSDIVDHAEQAHDNNHWPVAVAVKGWSKAQSRWLKDDTKSMTWSSMGRADTKDFHVLVLTYASLFTENFCVLERSDDLERYADYDPSTVAVFLHVNELGVAMLATNEPAKLRSTANDGSQWTSTEIMASGAVTEYYGEYEDLGEPAITVTYDDSGIYHAKWLMLPGHSHTFSMPKGTEFVRATSDPKDRVKAALRNFVHVKSNRSLLQVSLRDCAMTHREYNMALVGITLDIDVQHPIL